ncbi:MAG: 2-keto-3-deoxy-galactonokinase [Magnetovibrio sp.]|nr:2-keto-3-deoxy-galactonokinase [Magnetovibrio sp.]|tara:strand:+ start:1155 stop:2093 length:939 start_codon:yes stop_codon:yes gene_type:complete
MGRLEMIDEAIIVIDWGTSNRRAYFITNKGDVLEQRRDNIGILYVEDGLFGEVFTNLIGDWLERFIGIPVLMAGMIGSRQGWVEANYVLCPASLIDLAFNVISVPGQKNTWIVPGICLDPNGERRDVMRGEEVQVFGSLSLAGLNTSLLCLPGTHSKWVKVRNDQLLDFTTAMTGEVFDLMRDRSILGSLITKNSSHSTLAFEKGLNLALQPGGLLSHMFSLRADGLFGRTLDNEQESFLSGLLIGHEINAMIDNGYSDINDIVLVGTKLLTQVYSEAFRQRGIPFRVVDGEEAAIRGLSAIWNLFREEVHG